MQNKAQSSERDVILDSITEGVFTIDSNWHITSFNRAAEEITGIPCEKAVGFKCSVILRADVCETDCALRETMRTGKPIINKAVHIVDAKGERHAIAISTALLKDEDGKVIGGVETFRDMSLVEELQKKIEGRYCCEDIISQNHRMQNLFGILPNIAESDCTVLIEGESGTGKELFARAIHNLSFRKGKSFVAVSCGGDVSAAVQVRLLRVLQERTYEPLGAVSSVNADVRVIAAANKKLSELVEQGSFREDLYYRINVMRLELPPLRERKDDIPVLVNHFINRFRRLRKKNISCVTDEVLASLLAYEYPGNVRELENIIEHCFVLCQGEVIEKRHLPASVCPISSVDRIKTSEIRTLKQMEQLLIIEALRRNKGNQTATAKELGINKSTLFRKLKAYDIKSEASI
jgi:PAS domain S-box-containing protein